MSEIQWSEDDSVLFADLGAIFTPDREEIADTVVRHIPARVDEPFLAVDLCCGAGWLSEAILTALPAARVLALDGSPEMLRQTGERLARFGDRVSTGRFDLAAPGWLEAITEPVHCFVSSLAIHHLDGAGKRGLFQRLHVRLEPGGAFVYVDLIDPASEIGRRYAATHALRRRAGPRPVPTVPGRSSTTRIGTGSPTPTRWTCRHPSPISLAGCMRLASPGSTCRGSAPVTPSSSRTGQTANACIKGIEGWRSK